MKTEKQIQDAINEIRRNRRNYMEQLKNEKTEIMKPTIAGQIVMCENRIHDLTIALELAKEKEELLETLKMANEMLISKYGNLFKQWPESIEIEKVIKKNEP